VVVVEGYMDAISVYQAGFKAVVATLGTAFTEDQIQTLWRFSEEPIICYDGDRAGSAAAFRVIDRILPVLKVGNSFSFAFLPSGQDPDDLIKSGGIERFREVLSQAKPLWDVIWQRETNDSNITRPEQRAVLEKKLFELIREIKDPTLLKHFQSKAGTALRELFRQSDYKPWTPRVKGSPKAGFLPNAPTSVPNSMRQDDAEATLLGLCIAYPEIGRQHRNDLSRLIFKSAQGDVSHDAILHEILRIYDEHAPVTASALYAHADNDYTNALDIVHGRGDDTHPFGYRLFSRYQVLGAQPSGDFIERFFRLFCDKLILRHLEDELRQMVAKLDADDEEVFTRITTLRAETHRLQEFIHSRDLELGEEASLFRGQAQEG
jgi:DNA primase